MRMFSTLSFGQSHACIIEGHELGTLSRLVNIESMAAGKTDKVSIPELDTYTGK